VQNITFYMIFITHVITFITHFVTHVTTFITFAIDLQKTGSCNYKALTKKYKGALKLSSELQTGYTVITLL
jgi:hypothetical protein